MNLPRAEEIARLPLDGGAAFNRLIHESSPYLLQYARNPVDWFPWEAEAFAKAKREDKPVFLSIGYSTCCAGSAKAKPASRPCSTTMHSSSGGCWSSTKRLSMPST